jgi:hypothetical protein
MDGKETCGGVDASMTVVTSVPSVFISKPHEVFHLSDHFEDMPMKITWIEIRLFRKSG